VDCLDKFENGIATSIKSLDLGAPTYSTPAAITRVGTGYVDKVAAFQGRSYAQIDIRACQVTGRSLDIAVPPGATATQKQALQDVVNYGRGRA
jgi:filamentous hemagglutinin